LTARLPASEGSLSLRPARPEEAALLAELVAASFADVAQRLGLTRDNCPSYASFTDAAAIRRGFDYGSSFVLALARRAGGAGRGGDHRQRAGAGTMVRTARLHTARTERIAHLLFVVRYLQVEIGNGG
jgi:hypothetical protein